MTNDKKIKIYNCLKCFGHIAQMDKVWIFGIGQRTYVNGYVQRLQHIRSVFVKNAQLMGYVGVARGNPIGENNRNSTHNKKLISQNLYGY